jgi:pimeloyl-ACP methyl ester carboxylesterase
MRNNLCRTVSFVFVLVLASTGALRAQAASSPRPLPWQDPSPHRTHQVSVAPGVSLEVLDWGGHGDPLVLLAGLGDTAHVFDEFAMRLTDRWHVYAITRRGFGASSQPKAGYDIATLANDVRVALDALGLRRVALVGHSFGGDELTKVAATWPERVSRLVYLDAAYDRTGLPELRRKAPIPDPPAMTAADKASPSAVNVYSAAYSGVRLTEAEVRQVYVFDASGRMVRQRTPDSVGDLLIRGLEHPAYAKVQAPSLALYAVFRSPSDITPLYVAGSAALRMAAERFFSVMAPWSAEQRKLFAQEVKGARVVELPGANHYIFISNPADVLREMRAFLAGDAPER